MDNLVQSKANVISITLLTLRTIIGWHFLYEGLSKVFSPSWSAYSFLINSKWIFAGFFNWMAETPGILKVVDLLNVWGLILIGLALFFGIFTRAAAIFGICLLSFYYLAAPPFIGMDFGVLTEGHYLIVNKNLIELVVLIIFLVIPSSKIYGLDRLWKLVNEAIAQKKSRILNSSQVQKSIEVEQSIGRRELIKNLLPLPIFGGFVIASLKKKGWYSYEEKFLKDTDAMTTATMKSFDFSSLKDLKGQIPHTRIIGGVEFSRIILGGNLIGGWAHARDLIYMSKLVKAYHTDERVFSTFLLAERCGINAFLTNTVLSRVINKYWRNNIGDIKFISDCGGAADLITGAKMSIDSGAAACYVHGGWSDGYAAKGKFDEIQKVVEFIRQNGIPAGIGGHKIDTVKGCVEHGLKPDFWMKTLHHHNYWSARPDEKGKDNNWCLDPQGTIDYMNGLDEPWIAFKVMAAGAIAPEEGFKYAFENGADFVCAGMYDFQVVEDANIALNILNSDFMNTRKRRWLL